MSFTSDMDSAVRKIIDAQDKIARTATIDFFSGTVKDTPVDTGRARGNWVTTTDKPAQGEINREDKSGSSVISEIVAKTPEGAGQETFMSNSLPYIDKLEYGSSKQAPNGMVRRNLARVQRIVDQAIAKFRV
ncbi:HK97 gp10 family phage protein [Pseudomonas nitroreducens]|uniref:HK97 gp10 family phage protein n=1 Tax=Pseudomonas nitroreducens TaxID=46680 RepID=UPI00147495B6|nr:HK97 gp10 family phage protein [Pseudomonas nitroreducens]NMZ77476.1 HK97 gp10 family phage protein [Pseudomonas nitroreducens]